MSKHKILVVDDDPLISQMLVDMLRLQEQEYEVEAADRGAAALKKIAATCPDLVLLDLIMPDMDGYEVARRLRSDPLWSRVAIVMITGRDVSREKTKALEAGADDLLSKPICMPELLMRVRTALSAKAYRDRLEDERAYLAAEVDRQTAALRRAMEESSSAALEVVRRLARAVEFRDDDTGAHGERVSQFAEVIAEAMGLGAEECRLIRFAASMHDIGKIGVPDQVLHKAGPLTPSEREIIEMHTRNGSRILSGSSLELIRMAEAIAMSHHEWWNGQGYPERLSGEAIPLSARIVSVADALDAMVSKRRYSDGFGMDKALQEIQAMSGVQFDPKVVAACLAVRGRVDEIMVSQSRKE